jgi:hypothetical protein
MQREIGTIEQNRKISKKPGFTVLINQDQKTGSG